MKKCLLQATALLLALALGQSAQADNLAYSHAAGGCCDACGADHCDGGCCDYGCDTGCCDDGCYGGGYSWSGGAELIFVQPAVGSMEAFTVFENFLSGDATVRNFEWDYDPAWRVWAGVTDCEGWGYRVRYFGYDEESDLEAFEAEGGNLAIRNVDNSALVFLAAVFTFDDDDVLLAQADLEIENWDFEATQAFDSCFGTITLAGGLRYGRIESGVRYAAFNEGNLNDSLGAVAIEAEFDGIGPTFAIDLRRPMSSNLSFVTGMRTSILYGEADVEVDANAATINTLQDFEQKGRDAGVFIAEVMVGVEWSQCMSNGRVVYARAAWENQYYSGMPVAIETDDNFNNPSEIFMEGYVLGAGVLY